MRETYSHKTTSNALLKKRRPAIFLQFSKFVLIGGLNTLIDFLVLNLLIAIFSSGNSSSQIVLFKALSFIAAVTNSYFCNKFWVFKGIETVTKSEGMSFFIISLLGFVLNITVFSGIFYILNTTGYGSFGTQTISNLAALVGTIVVLLFNFTGYKYFVFKS